MKINQSKSIPSLLLEKADYYETLDFIKDDPILIPHSYSKKEDIEIAGFLTAIIAWGQRKTILNNASKMMAYLDNSPFDFILNHEETDLKRMQHFVHRTFNSDDLLYFVARLKLMYQKQGGLEAAFSQGNNSMQKKISLYKKTFFEEDHLFRTEKHVSDPMKGSSAKRINMYLRWMVRDNKKGVDFGIWKSIPPSELLLPLDIHTGNVSRKLGLLSRKQNDWRAVEELTSRLREISPTDPVKLDFALFGMGVNGEL